MFNERIGLFPSIEDHVHSDRRTLAEPGKAFIHPERYHLARHIVGRNEVGDLVLMEANVVSLRSGRAKIVGLTPSAAMFPIAEILDFT